MHPALFFDIDGTLISFKTHAIPQSTVEAIRTAKENGASVYISTGRPLQLITNLKSIEQYIDGYMTTNGALCFIGSRIVNRVPIDKCSLKRILDDVRDNDYCCIVVGQSGVRLLNPKPIFEEIFVKGLCVTNIDKRLSAEEMICSEDIFQLSPFFCSEHEEILMSQISGCVSGRWHPSFTDITSVAADKGNGLIAMAVALGIDLQQTIAFGDGGNDIPILRTAGIGIAMGNASDEVKQAANYITSTVDDDGIMKALQHFGII